MKNIPERTCIGCKAKKNKKDLQRIVKTKDGKILLEKSEKLEGRGAYICKSKECLEKAYKNKGLDRSYKMKVKNEFYENLKNMSDGGDAIE